MCKIEDVIKLYREKEKKIKGIQYVLLKNQLDKDIRKIYEYLFEIEKKAQSFLDSESLID